MDSHQVEGPQPCSFSAPCTLPRIDATPSSARAAGRTAASWRTLVLTLPAIQRPSRPAASLRFIIRRKPDDTLVPTDSLSRYASGITRCRLSCVSLAECCIFGHSDNSRQNPRAPMYDASGQYPSWDSTRRLGDLLATAREVCGAPVFFDPALQNDAGVATRTPQGKCSSLCISACRRFFSVCT